MDLDAVNELRYRIINTATRFSNAIQKGDMAKADAEHKLLNEQVEELNKAMED